MSTTQVMEREHKPPAIVVLRDRLLERRTELEAALDGSGISVDRFIRTAVTAATMQSELVSDVSFQSLWIALLQACRDRLLPDGRQGVIVPYKRQAKWIPMYQGLLQRFAQSGEYTWVTARVVRDDDKQWDLWIDEKGEHFTHRPGPGRGNVTATYAAAGNPSGGCTVTEIHEEEMQRIRAMSRARGEDSPWNNWTDEMRKKSALRRLCKMLPGPVDEMITREDEDENETPLAPAAPMLSSPKPPARARGAANALDQFAGEIEPPVEDREPVMKDEFAGHAPPTQVEPEQPPQEDPTMLVRIDTARERGKQARIDGMKSTAVPPEYREPGRSKEAIAWKTGWGEGGANA